MIHLDYRDARPIYSQIIDGFREQIAAGILKPGDKLPSVRGLAAELAINPNTIQRSYRQLELEGWTVSIQGKGCFVSGEMSIRQREADRLLTEFDKVVASLERCGVDRRELMARLEKEE
jgi:GntR family transcriptional regulator